MEKNNCKIINSKTGEKFYTTEAAIYRAVNADDGEKCFRQAERNRAINSAKTSDGFSTWTERFEAIKYAAQKIDQYMTEEQVAEKIAFDSDWHNQPMTEKQYSYMVALGIKNINWSMTKGQASELIDLVKREGLGTIGQTDDDGDTLTNTCEIY